MNNRADDMRDLIERTLRAEILGEAQEQNCDQHVHPLIVTYEPRGSAKQHSTGLTAALLRVIAVYEDGFCAVRGAEDADLTEPEGLRFHFTSDEKLKAFHGTARSSLNADVIGCLTFRRGPRPA